MGFQAYEEIVNLHLLWQMKDLIKRISTKNAQYVTWMTLFRDDEPKQGMEEAYQLRYPGEVLERYWDKCGDSIENMRALAIALAERCETLEDGMFVGNQKVVFMNRVRALASEDIFLKGALLKLTDRNTEKMQLEEELRQYKPKSTQEFVYLQSVLQAASNENDLDMDQCIRFFGSERTIEAYGNQRVFAWMLQNYMKKIASYRKNDGKYLKAFSQMLSSQVKEGTPLWKSLIDVGYSKQEIIYLQMNLPLLRELNGRLKKDSITMERIVTWGCSEILNAEYVESPVLYEEMRRFLEMYRRFAVRIEGYSGLPEILKYEVKLKDVGLFLFLYKEYCDDSCFKNWFKVNLLEDKWDKLSDGLAPKEYLELFEDCFEDLAEYGQEKDWMTKYEKLRGESYLRQFWTKYRSDISSIFYRLVYVGVYDIVSLLKQYAQERNNMDAKLLDEKWHNMLKYMAYMASSMKCHAIFEFWEMYERLFGMAELREFLGDRDVISTVVHYYRSYDYRDQQLFKDLDFLTKEEKIKLFYWECDELFAHSPETYNRFLVHFLIEVATDLFSSEQCRELFEVVMTSLNADSSDAERLRNMYFTQEEMNQYVQMKKECEEKAKREREREKYLSWKSELLKGLDDDPKSTRLSVIVNNANRFRLDKEYFELVHSCIMKEIESGYRQIEQDVITDLLELWGTIVEENICKWDDFCEFVKQVEVVKGES